MDDHLLGIRNHGLDPLSSSKVTEVTSCRDGLTPNRTHSPHRAWSLPTTIVYCDGPAALKLLPSYYRLVVFFARTDSVLSVTPQDPAWFAAGPSAQEEPGE